MSKSTEWAAHVSAWRQGELSAAAYCEAHGLKVSTLRYWASRVGPDSKRVRLARVKKTKAPLSSSTLRLVSVEIPSHLDGDALRQVLELFGAKR